MDKKSTEPIMGAYLPGNIEQEKEVFSIQPINEQRTPTGVTHYGIFTRTKRGYDQDSAIEFAIVERKNGQLKRTERKIAYLEIEYLLLEKIADIERTYTIATVDNKKHFSSTETITETPAQPYTLKSLLKSTI